MKKILSMLVSASLAASTFAGVTSGVYAENIQELFAEDFSQTRAEIVAKAQIQARAVTKWDVMQDDTLASQVVYIQKTAKGGGFVRTPQADYTSPVTGNIQMSCKFMVSNTSNVEYYPLTFKSDKQIKTDDSVYDFAKMIYISNGKFYVANPAKPSSTTIESGIYTTAEVADVTANQWYNLTIMLNVDGDEATFDSWSYSLTRNDGTVVANGEDYVLGVSQGNAAYNFFNLSGINRFVFGYVGNTSADSDSILYMDDISIGKIIVPPEVSGCSVNTDDAIRPVITVDFNQDMDASTFSGITVKQSNGEMTVFEVSPSNGISNKCTITFTKDLLYETAYTFTIPETVTNPNGEGVAEFSRTFTTPKFQIPIEESFYSEDFTQTRDEIVAKEQIQARAVTKWDVMQDDTLESQVVYIQKTKNGGGFVRTPQADYTSPVTGNIQMSCKFMVSNTSNVEYYPLTFKSDKQIKTDDTVFDFAKMIYISNGKFYVANPAKPSSTTIESGIYTTEEVGDVTANQWYNLTIMLNVDGDEATFDSWSYSLTRNDGTVVANGEDYVLGVSQGNATYNFFNLSGINRFVFGYVGNTSADSDSVIYMDDVSIVKLEAPEVTASVENGAQDVSVEEEITLSFSQPVNAENFDQITLTKDGENISVSARPATGYSNSCTITFAEALDYNRDYILTVPKMKTETNLYSEPLKISFRTELIKNMIEISNLTVNNGGEISVTSGEKITVSADFKNISAKAAENASLIVAVYSKEGTMYGVAYKKITLEAGKSSPLSVELTVPEKIGENGYIAVYAWNDISSMTPITDSVIKP